MKPALSSELKIDYVWLAMDDVTNQLSEADLEAMEEILLTTSCWRGKYAAAPFSVCEETVEIAVWQEGFGPAERIRFYLVGGQEKYAFQTMGRMYRIRNGEEMLRAILAIIQ